jgi:hypothetical protein
MVVTMGAGLLSPDEEAVALHAASDSSPIAIEHFNSGTVGFTPKRRVWLTDTMADSFDRAKWGT